MNDSEAESPFSFLVGGGGMARRICEFDWSRTALGPPGRWPQSLRSALSICLGCGFPIAIYWGRDLALLYNDAWSPIPAAKHPWALGKPAHEVWPEIWEDIAPLFVQVQTSGEPVRRSDQLLMMRRRGFTEECYFDFTFSPIRDEEGGVGGIFNAAIETTSRVLAERRARLLRDLAASIVDAPTPEAVARCAAQAFDTNRNDLPFTLLYLKESDGMARLAATSGISTQAFARLPAVVDMRSSAAPLPFMAAARRPEGTGLRVEKKKLDVFCQPLSGDPWEELVDSLIIHALPQAGGDEPAGFLVAALSPRLAWDDEYRGAVAQAANGVAAALARARAHAAERERAAKLAEIDRAKTAFFSNVSHEFRTPLTLLLGPLEEIVNRSDGRVFDENRELAIVAHRNALRLLRLVNALLDFSRLEAGRAQAHFEPTDLAACTAELASAFRSAMEKAGLRFTVECEPLPQAFNIDREMWEKIVFNLLSNAFKFTLTGEVRITLRAVDGGGAELTVRDTGRGIAPEAQQHLFGRFYRVQGMQGRSQEGSGIGLALVDELVRLHGGTVRVESAQDQGSTFIVALPAARQAAGAASPDAGRPPAATTAAPFVSEALRWLPASDGVDGPAVTGTPGPECAAVTARPRVLLVEDNADMRDYIARLLSPHFDVTAAADGESALAAVHASPPDLVLSDIMMARIDGLGLLRALRSHPATSALPVILLSARAGEEARVEGVEHGADDYLVKPFSARELVARVSTHLALGRLRREAAAGLKRSEERYSAFVANSSEGVWRLELDPPVDTSLPVETQVELACRDGWLAECNDVMARMYGLKDAGELIGRKLDFVLPASDPQAREFIASVIRGGYRIVDVESEERDAAGNTVHFSNSMTGVVEDGRLKRLWGTQRDISARKRAEEALRESEERYRLLFDRSPLPTFVVDVESLRFLAANDAVLSLYGYTWEEFASLTLLDIRPAEDVEDARLLIDKMPASGDVVTLRKELAMGEVHRHKRKDGSVLYVEPRVLQLVFKGRRAWLATVTDVTSKRRSDDHVKWLADFPGQNPNPVIEVDLAKGRVFYANRYSLRRFPDLESLGLGHPFLAGIEEAARPLIEGKIDAMGREVFADGSWFMQSLCHLPDTQHVRMYCVNISALKDAEKQLRENEERLLLARDEAEQASRAKDRFLAVLSHELRTPLTPVLMAVSALENDTSLSEAVRDDLAMMKRNIELETKLIDDLLDLSRITSGKLKLDVEPVDLNEIVRHACEICRPQLHECGVRLEADLDAAVGVVSADPARLQQVLWNVLKNAIKFSSRRSVIRITTRQADGAHVEVRIQDNGVGIPEERLPHIFNAFEQGGWSVTRKFGGLGLGLAISKALIDLHRGSIRAESAGHGRGATFIIELPGKVLTATARIRLSSPVDTQLVPKLRVLVVEDHADTLRTLTRLLAGMGFTVFTASSVASAADVASRETFDLLVSDLGLPDGDGREVMRRVRARGNVLGIAMSGYGTDEDVRRSREAGFSEHLTKPVEFSTLKQVIFRLAGGRPPQS